MSRNGRGAKPPFGEPELQTARERLEAAGFPLTGNAAELQQLGTDEPFHTYTLAAGESLRALQQVDDPKRLVKAARRTADIVDRLTKWIGDTVPTGKGKPLKIACKAGCFYCCSIRVNVLSSEIASISDFIQSRFSSEDRSYLTARAEEFVATAKSMTPRTRFLKPMLCPLNKDGLCTVYDVRPIACRSHHSFSVDQCRFSFDHWEEDHPVTRSAMRKACNDAATMALVDVLEFLELDARAFELPEALTIALGVSELSECVLGGEDVLGGAHIPAISEAAAAPDLFKPS